MQWNGIVQKFSSNQIQIQVIREENHQACPSHDGSMHSQINIKQAWVLKETTWRVLYPNASD